MNAVDLLQFYNLVNPEQKTVNPHLKALNALEQFLRRNGVLSPGEEVKSQICEAWDGGLPFTLESNGFSVKFLSDPEQPRKRGVAVYDNAAYSAEQTQSLLKAMEGNFPRMQRRAA
jgi:hypothetical protein